MKKLKLLVMLILFAGLAANAQENKSTDNTGGGHEESIYGVKIGMTVEEALRSVFEVAKREPGKEKPDSMRREGDGDKDIRVFYNNLPLGNLQIVFDGGKYVREITLQYARRPTLDDINLPSDSSGSEATSGKRLDDRYTIGFVDSKKQEKLWWRDFDSGNGYKIRIMFRSGNLLKDGQLWWQTLTTKTVVLSPKEEKKFRNSFDKK